MKMLPVRLLILLLPLYISSFTAQGQPAEFTLGDSLTALHVPIINSKLYLDTAAVDFRPLISLQGGDWTSKTNDASFLVMAFQKSDTPNSELQGLFDRIDTKWQTPLYSL